MAQTEIDQAAIEELERLERALPPTTRTDTPGHLTWKLEMRTVLEEIFGSESGLVREFERLMQAVEERPLWENTVWAGQQFMKKVVRKARESKARKQPERVAREPSRTTKSNLERHRIFVVHGHDESAREKVARFLEKLGLEPVVLHEQASQGLTVIEKFTQHANVSFAIVLLTSDDIGGTKGSSFEKLLPRARQNVLLELGYFLGTLGRAHVCALVQPGVEIPSDYGGVLYVELDKAGAWRTHIAKEMKAAGLPIDMNNAL